MFFLLNSYVFLILITDERKKYFLYQLTFKSFSWIQSSVKTLWRFHEQLMFKYYVQILIAIKITKSWKNGYLSFFDYRNLLNDPRKSVCISLSLITKQNIFYNIKICTNCLILIYIYEYFQKSIFKVVFIANAVISVWR